jgi:hypothetical protein
MVRPMNYPDFAQRRGSGMPLSQYSLRRVRQLAAPEQALCRVVGRSTIGPVPLDSCLLGRAPPRRLVYDHPAVSPLASFNAGLQAWSQGRFFEAHEHWEQTWRCSSDPVERQALKGLIQLAASLVKAERGAPRGHAKLWTKARQHLASAAREIGSLHGVDLVALVRRLVEAPSTQPPAMPARVPEFGVLYLHGFGSSPGSPKGRAVSTAVASSGVPVRAPVLADAEDFFDFTVSRNLERARRCLFERTLVIGSSLGGWTAALLAQNDRRVIELILLCPAFHFADRWFRPDRSDELVRWRAQGQLSFDVGHPPQLRPLSVRFVDDATTHAGAPVLRVPTTIIHGHRDDVVPLADVASAIRDQPIARMHVVDDDHGLRDHLPSIARFCRARAVARRAEADESWDEMRQRGDS